MGVRCGSIRMSMAMRIQRSRVRGKGARWLVFCDGQGQLLTIKSRIQAVANTDCIAVAVDLPEQLCLE